MVNHLVSIIPMQILVEKIAKLKQINPDMPRNLAKTVTVWGKVSDFWVLRVN